MSVHDITNKDLYYEALKRMTRGDSRFRQVEDGPNEKAIVFSDPEQGVTIEMQALAFHDVEGTGWDYYCLSMDFMGNPEPLSAEERQVFYDELKAANEQQFELPLR